MTRGFRPKIPTKRFINTASNEEKKQVISRIPKDFTDVVEDESLFIHDILIKVQ